MGRRNVREVVRASAAIGALLGRMHVSVIAKLANSDTSNGDLVAGCMASGLWAALRQDVS
jgi:hypothetical protein